MDQAEVDKIFFKAFGISADTVRNLAKSHYCVFEPLHLVALRKKADNEFTAEFLTGIFKHKNARPFFMSCGELPYLSIDLSSSPFGLGNLLDNDDFWDVYANSPEDNNSHIGKPSLLNAFFRGAFQEAMERRKLNPAATTPVKARDGTGINLADAMTKNELYPNNTIPWTELVNSGPPTGLDLY